MRITTVGSVNIRIRNKRGSRRKSFSLPRRKKKSCRLALPNESEGNYETLPLQGVTYFPERWDHAPTLTHPSPSSCWQEAFMFASRSPEELPFELPSEENVFESIDTSLVHRFQADKTQSQAARSMSSLTAQPRWPPTIPDPCSPNLPTTEEINTLAPLSLPSPQPNWKASRPGRIRKVVLRPFAI